MDKSHPVNKVDLTPVVTAFDSALAALLTSWQGVKSTWVQWFSAEVGRTLHAGDRAGLASLPLPSLSKAKGLVSRALNAFATTSAGLVIAELAQQGKTGVTPQTPREAELETDATLATTLLATSLGQSLGSEAVRVHGPNSAVPVTQQHVARFGDSLTDAQVRYTLGGALHGAGNSARILTMLGVVDLSLYASEEMDANTCEPCSEIDGAFLADVGSGDLSKVYELYPVHGYIDCLGRDRCRGTVVGVWQKGGE